MLWAEATVNSTGSDEQPLLSQSTCQLYFHTLLFYDKSTLYYSFSTALLSYAVLVLIFVLFLQLFIHILLTYTLFLYLIILWSQILLNAPRLLFAILLEHSVLNFYGPLVSTLYFCNSFDFQKHPSHPISLSYLKQVFQGKIPNFLNALIYFQILKNLHQIYISLCISTIS